MELSQSWPWIGVLIVAGSTAIAINGFFLLAFGRRRNLRTLPNRFIINLLINNLVGIFSLVPTVALLLAYDSRQSKQHAVVLQQKEKVVALEDWWQHMTALLAVESCLTIAYGSSLLSIVLIAINQYIAVLHSLRYHFLINQWRATAAIAAAWLVSCLVSTVLLVVPPSYWPTTVALLRAALFGISLGAISAIYVCVYWAAHKSSQRMRHASIMPACHYHHQWTCHHGRAMPPTPVITTCDDSTETTASFLPEPALLTSHKVVDDMETEAHAGTATPLLHALMRRPRWAHSAHHFLFRDREETRTGRVSLVVVVLVVFCYAPIVIVQLAAVLSGHADHSALVNGANYQGVPLMLVALGALLIAYMVTPFVFAYRSKRIKHELSRWLGYGSPPYWTATSVTGTTSPPKAVLYPIMEGVHQNSTTDTCCHTKVVQITLETGRGSFSSVSTQTSTEDI